MTRRCYTLSTQDPEAFRRLVDAAANLGTFSVCVIEVKEPPIASKPPPGAVGWKDGFTIAAGTLLPNPDGAH